jgi:uncharacterized protein YbjT (DUF2867 family)
MTKVAIVGATGPTGIHLATELRKTTPAVRVVARGMDKPVRLFLGAAVEKRAVHSAIARPKSRSTMGR